MAPTRRTTLELLGAATAAGLAGGLAGCAGTGGPGDEETQETTEDGMGGDGNDGTTAGGDDETTEGGTTDDGMSDGATVMLTDHPEFGEILADDEGRILYLFTQDEGGESVCYDSCEENWPPLVVEDDPAAGEGVTAELGTTERDDGSMQVTAAGNPLYYFAGDAEPGDVNGQGINDVWFVLSADGTAVEGTEDEEEAETTEEMGY